VDPAGDDTDGSANGDDDAADDDDASGPDGDGDGWTSDEGDCDDSDPATHPHAAESCDSTDNDCDGTIDEGMGCGGTLDLGSADAKLTTPEYHLEAGLAVASAGDVDGDGYGDVLVGAEDWNSEGMSRAGKVFVVSGPLNGEFDLAEATAVWTGEGSDDGAGGSLAGAGDVNGDGYDDILIGAKQDNYYEDDPGRAYLVFGPTMGTHALSVADVELVGESADSWCGHSVAAAGDVDGNGVADILIGAPYESSEEYFRGAAYLMYGPITAGTVDLAAADVRLLGGHVQDTAGTSVAGAGDVDGDGIDDVLIGAPGSDVDGSDTAAAYLVHGPIDQGTQHLAEADAWFIRPALGSEAGDVVAGAGDVDGDGFDDVLIGDYAGTGNGFYAGVTYLVRGPIDGPIDLSSQADAAFAGEAGDDLSGSAVAGAGDINGDGYDDLLIGAPNHVEPAYFSGAAYLLFGPLAGPSDLADADIKILGEGEIDDAGSAVAAAGDINGDGWPDILVGAPGESSIEYGQGAAYLLLGSP